MSGRTDGAKWLKAAFLLPSSRGQRSRSEAALLSFDLIFADEFLVSVVGLQSVGVRKAD